MLEKGIQNISSILSNKLVGSFVVQSLSDNFEESCLVRKCRELEDMFGTNFTGQILNECNGDMGRIMTAIKVDME